MRNWDCFVEYLPTDTRCIRLCNIGGSLRNARDMVDIKPVKRDSDTIRPMPGSGGKVPDYIDNNQTRLC